MSPPIIVSRREFRKACRSIVAQRYDQRFQSPALEKVTRQWRWQILKREVILAKESGSGRVISRGKVIVALAVAAWALVILIIWGITLTL